MTTPASHHLPAVEVVAIDGSHHLDHPSSYQLARIVGSPVDFLGARAGMALGAVKTQCGAHDAHRSHEVVYGNSYEHLNILEDLIRGRMFRTRLGCRLSGGKGCGEQPTRHHHCDH